MKNRSSQLAMVCSFALAALTLADDALAFADSRFENPVDKGNYGEAVTKECMEARGYRSLPSKVNGNQGIDHVFVKCNPDGTISEIRLCETKTDTSPYDPNQMSDARIDEQIKRMKASPDPEVRKTAELLEKNRRLIKKELWQHNTLTGKTTVSELDGDGTPTQKKTEFPTKRAQRKLMAARQKSESKQTKSLPPKETAPQCANRSAGSEARVAGGRSATARRVLPLPDPRTTRVLRIAVHTVDALEVVGRGYCIYRTEDEYNRGLIDLLERGKRHARNVGECVGGIVGARIGAIVGSRFGPPGVIVGVTVGATVGDRAGSKIGETVWLVALQPIEKGRLKQQFNLSDFYARVGDEGLAVEDLADAGFDENETRAFADYLEQKRRK